MMRSSFIRSQKLRLCKISIAARRSSNFETAMAHDKKGTLNYLDFDTVAPLNYLDFDTDRLLYLLYLL
jgi:hypothetical protein